MPSLPLSRQFQDALPLAKPFNATCIRIVNTSRTRQGQALSPEGSRIHGGRYNPKDEFGVLYLSCDAQTCQAELLYYLNRSGIDLAELKPDAKTMVEVSVKLSKVLDLSDPAVRDAIGLTESELAVEWESLGSEALTQSIGRFARDAGFEALLVPSARHQGRNLVILTPDNLSSDSHVQEIKQEILHISSN